MYQQLRCWRSPNEEGEENLEKGPENLSSKTASVASDDEGNPKGLYGDLVQGNRAAAVHIQIERIVSTSPWTLETWLRSQDSELVLTVSH